MSQANNIGNEVSNKKNSAFETKFSFALALITMMLIFGYFFQSAVYIYQQKTIVVAIERIDAKVDSNNKQQSIGLNNLGSE